MSYLPLQVSMVLRTGRVQTPNVAGSALRLARRSWPSLRRPSLSHTILTLKWKSPLHLELGCQSLPFRYAGQLAYVPQRFPVRIFPKTPYKYSPFVAYFSTGVVSKSTRTLFQEQEIIKRTAQALCRIPLSSISQPTILQFWCFIPLHCPLSTSLPCSMFASVHQALSFVGESIQEYVSTNIPYP